jgi:hypothetical protein
VYTAEEFPRLFQGLKFMQLLFHRKAVYFLWCMQFLKFRGHWSAVDKWFLYKACPPTKSISSSLNKKHLLYIWSKTLDTRALHCLFQWHLYKHLLHFCNLHSYIVNHTTFNNGLALKTGKTFTWYLKVLWFVKVSAGLENKTIMCGRKITWGIYCLCLEEIMVPWYMQKKWFKS